MNGARASIEVAIVIMSIRSSRLSGNHDVWSKWSTRRRGVLPGTGLKGRASGWREANGPIQILPRSAGVIAPNHEIIRSSNRRVLIALEAILNLRATAGAGNVTASKACPATDR